MVVLDLHSGTQALCCCVAFSSCGEQLLILEHRLQGMQASVVVALRGVQ